MSREKYYRVRLLLSALPVFALPNAYPLVCACACAFVCAYVCVCVCRYNAEGVKVCYNVLCSLLRNCLNGREREREREPGITVIICIIMVKLI